MTSIPSTFPATTAAVAGTASTGSASTTGASTSGTASQQFNSADFMTLLVAEMKNQDPTAPTDPTQYISQLVGVNSLEQLSEINGKIQGPSTSSSSASGSGATGTSAV